MGYSLFVIRVKKIIWHIDKFSYINITQSKITAKKLSCTKHTTLHQTIRCQDFLTPHRISSLSGYKIG